MAKMGRPSKKDQPISPAETVRTMKAFGIPTDEIAKVMKVSPTTLRKHYAHELEVAESQINAKVAGFLFANAEGGNVSAQIFWPFTRSGSGISVCGSMTRTALALTRRRTLSGSSLGNPCKP
jgi:hypothetical protein